jgi:hypothetical protein
LGLWAQLEERAKELDVEAAFVKPFCALQPDPAKPIIAIFLRRLELTIRLLNPTSRRCNFQNLVFFLITIFKKIA